MSAGNLASGSGLDQFAHLRHTGTFQSWFPDPGSPAVVVVNSGLTRPKTRLQARPTVNGVGPSKLRISSQLQSEPRGEKI